MGTAPRLRIPQQQRALRTRDRLVEEAKVLFARRGYAETTGARVTKAAGVAKGTFYNHFRNKDELLVEIARQQFEDQRERLLRLFRPLDSSEDMVLQVRKRVRDVVILVADHHRSDPQLHATITERRHADESFDAFCHEYEAAQLEYVVRFLESVGFSGDTEATAFVLYTMVEGAMHTHVLGKARVEDERLFGTLIDSVVGIILSGAT